MNDASEEKKIVIPEVITVRELADLLQVSPIQLIKSLMSNGVLANINQQIDFETAAIVASEFGYEAELPYIGLEEEEEGPAEVAPWQRIIANEKPENLKPRPPVVTVLGHVDHGKTSLLDAIRHTNLVARESGGITQHIGAYQVKHGDHRITFLDTPGHEAFTAMRARGAHTADIAVLVVAADDGVKPQTIEAINHARAAHVPIIVALNKIDKPNARPEYVKKELADLGLVPDEWGGETMVIPVSAKQRLNIEDLLEAIVLVAEEAGIKANPSRPAVGTVLEGRLDRRRGPLATVLILNWTLRTGDAVVVGETWGKVRALEDEHGRRHRTTPPGTPAVLIGLHDVPKAGDIIEAVKDERTARAIAAKRKEESRLAQQSARRKVLSLDDISARIREGKVEQLNVILKTDVQGSIEPIVTSLERLSNEQTKVEIIHAAAGVIGESDVSLAAASDAVVIGFRVDIDPVARRLAESEGVEIKIYEVIYELIDEVEQALKGLLKPAEVEKVIGTAEVRATFDVPKVGRVAGCRVREGVVRRNARVRLLREGKIIYEGAIASLKRFSRDVREVREGYECGIKLDGFEDVQAGDLLQCFVMVRGETEGK